MGKKESNTATATDAARIDPIEEKGSNDQNVSDMRETILAADAERRAAIRAAFKPIAGITGAGEIRDQCMDDPKCSVDDANRRALAFLGAQGAPISVGLEPPATAGEDETDKRRSAMTDVLLHRAGIARMNGGTAPPVSFDLNGNPFRGMSLVEIAKASLTAAGVDVRGLSKMDVVAASFQTTDDFPILLENTMHKVVQRAYQVAPDTWRQFCAVGSVSDFRAHNRYRTGSISNLDTITEHGEYLRKTIPDGEKSTITASTRGNIIAITREAIVNDDLGALTNQATMLGRAASRTIEAQVYTTLLANPALEDGVALFHANHGNIESTTVGVPSVATFDACRVLMAQQLDVSGNDYLDIRPAVWLGPIALGGTARVVNGAQYDPDTANKLQMPNKVAGLVNTIVDTPRLTGDPWYLFADPADAPVLEVAFLDGEQSPAVETRNGWNTNGAEMRVRLDFGVAAIDYRGAVKNNGA